MKIMSDKKFNQILKNKELEHLIEINKVSYEFDHVINKLSDKNFNLRLEINELQRQVNSLESNKIRYLKMMENKTFRSKRLKKKYQDKLIKKIELLFGGEENE